MIIFSGVATVARVINDIYLFLFWKFFMHLKVILKFEGASEDSINLEIILLLDTC